MPFSPLSTLPLPLGKRGPSQIRISPTVVIVGGHMCRGKSPDAILARESPLRSEAFAQLHLSVPPRRRRSPRDLDMLGPR